MNTAQLNVLKATIRHVGGMDTDHEIWAHDRFDEDLNFDSLDKQELAINLEECFDLALPEEQVSQWRTVADAIGTLGAALAHREGATA